MNQKRVGILRGGAGEDYESSLRKGGEIISHMFENLSDKYKPVDILVDKDYIWYMNGLPVSPTDLMGKVDVVWNAAHPSLSNILESLYIPNISASGFSSALQNSRDMLREHMKQIGIQMPRHIILPAYQKDFDSSPEKYAIKKAKAVFEKFSSPWVVRSLTSYSPMEVHLARIFPELIDAISEGVKYETSILVEEFISGKVASVHCVAGFRGEDIYAFPPLEIFGNISGEEKEMLTKLARGLHDHIGAKYYSKSNFVLHPRGKVYLIHIDSIPDLKQGSYFSQACESVGAKTHHVTEHILEKAFI